MKTEYRPNVAAILEDGEGRILVGERVDVEGAWQFPQGGVDAGESDEEALVREVEEELGIGEELYEVLERREGYRYRFAGNRVKRGRYHGQEQVYFRCRYNGGDADFDLGAHQREFSRLKWILPGEFEMDWVPEFKRGVYAAVLRDFYEVG
ncbi:MAG: NUDIX domain-containing protein [Verrucomicrobiales bacterium]|nr:NUDIX domain-containing protein [Verrucomicrobiales bacterium]